MSETAVATLFAQSGVIRTDTLAEAFDVAQLLATQPVPAGRPGGDRRQLDRARRARAGRLPGRGAGGRRRRAGRPRRRRSARRSWPARSARPLRSGRRRRRRRGLRAAGGDRRASSTLRRCGDGRRDAEKPVVTTFLAVDGLPEHLAVPGRDGGAGRGSVPSYRTPERAVAALAHAVRYGAWRARPAGESARLRRGRPRARPALFVDSLAETAATDRALADDELVRACGCYGIEVVAFRTAASAEAAVAAAEELGFPVALKTSDETHAAPDGPGRGAGRRCRTRRRSPRPTRCSAASPGRRSTCSRWRPRPHRRGHRVRDRRRPVVRRAGVVRDRRAGHRTARRPGLPGGAADRRRRRRADRRPRAPRRCSTATAVRGRSTGRRWRTWPCGCRRSPTTCPRSPRWSCVRCWSAPRASR